MKRFNLVICLSFSIVISSCSSYINRIHNALDKQENRSSIKSAKRSDPYGIYRNAKKDKRPFGSPITYSNKVSPRNIKNAHPKVKRNYKPGRLRYKADDLVDNANSSSLWAGNGKENYLFSTDSSKRIGDIVILEVMKEFKNEISNELKRSFPVVRRKKKTAAKGDPAKGDKPEEEAGDPVDDATAQIYDKVSTQIIEEISNNYLLIRGRKE
ncbi:MAG: flagellar L-ring protein precursor FlgH, partial [Thermoproteota archaeon]